MTVRFVARGALAAGFALARGTFTAGFLAATGFTAGFFTAVFLISMLVTP
jgi:hypothetical protein